jgi:hypothetical protein
MKIHIIKDKKEKKSLFGGIKSWYTVNAYYELSDEERRLLNENRSILEMVLFTCPFRGPNGDIVVTQPQKVKQLVNEKYLTDGEGYSLGCFFSNGEVQEVEDMINEGAKNLKAELYGGSLGTSTTEI